MATKAGFTTTDTLPAEVREIFEIPIPLEGGPVFALPAYGQGSIDFSQLEIDTAEALIKAGFPYLRKREKASAKAPKE